MYGRSIRDDSLELRPKKRKVALRVQVPKSDIPGIWVIVTAAQVLGKYVIIGSLDP